MPCSSCGGGNNSNINPLDCTTRFMQCDNPCSARPGVNTPACESLPSQIENFTLQFFGTVVKTEVDGRVTWSLPCSLDVGLPNNPRAVDEGLACYFLRLFHEGIVGLTGPQGETGAAGTNGNNAYTVTLKSFTQPTIGSPIVQVLTTPNPAILNSLYVFIANSGWYLVQENDGNGTLLLSLARAVSGASGTITAGKLVVPAGFPGASVTGPQGQQGPKGDPGPAATAFTQTNGFYFADVGTDFPLPLVYTPVDFVNSAPQILLPSAGFYLVNVAIDVVGTAGVAATDIASFKLRNTTIAADVPGTEHSQTVGANGERRQVIITARVETDASNQTITIYGKATSAAVMSAVALHTTVSYVRLQ